MAAHRFNFLLTTRCFWSSSSFSKPNNPTVALRPVANTNRLFFFAPKPLLPSFGIIASPIITTSSSCTTDQTSPSSFEAATAATSSGKRPSSGNYKPSIWTHEVLKTLKNDYECEIVRGDILKSIPFYMHDKGVTEVIARDYIRHLTDEEWKKLNSELWTESPLPQDFIKAVVNFARMTESLYQYGDGVSIQERGTKDNLIALLVNNIPIV